MEGEGVSRWWHRFFPQEYPILSEEADKELVENGFPENDPAYLETHCYLSFFDRLRVLVSGKLAVRCLVRATPTFDKVFAISEVSVLPPDA